MTKKPGNHAPPVGSGQIALSLEPAVARRQLETALRARGWEGDVAAVVLALNEALVNAGEHAGGARRAEARIERSALEIEICDRGTGFDPAPYVERPPEIMAERGRGVWLMSRLADSWDIGRDDDGGRLVLRFFPEHSARRAG